MKTVLSLAVALFLSHLTIGQDGERPTTPEGVNEIEIPDSPYLHFTKDGKMGLMAVDSASNKWQSFIEPKYDFIIQVPFSEHLLFHADGRYSLYSLEKKKVVLKDLKNSVDFFSYEDYSYNRYRTDIDYYSEYETPEYLSSLVEGREKLYLLDKDNWVKNDTLSIPQLNSAKLSVKMSESNDLVINYNSVDQTSYLVAYQSIEYPGEDSIDWNGNVVYYPRAGISFAAVYDVSEAKWKLPPEYEFMLELNRGYEFFPKNDPEEEYKGVYIEYYDKEFNPLIKRKLTADFTMEDTLKYLPKGAEIIDAPGDYDYHIYYKVNNKIGVFIAYPGWVSERDLVDPKYDFVTNAGVEDFFIGIKDGKFMFEPAMPSMNYTKPILPRSPKKSVEVAMDRYSPIIIVDDKYFFVQSTNDEIESVWKQVDTNREEIVSTNFCRLEKLDEDKILYNINTIDPYPEAFMSEEYPGEDSIDANGNFVYYYYGKREGRLFSLEKNDWLTRPYEQLDKTPLGYFAYDNYVKFDQYSYPINYSKGGVLDKNLNMVIPQEYNYIRLLDDMYLCYGEKTAAYTIKGKEVIKAEDYGYLDYKDGFFFQPADPKESDEYPGELMITEDGEIVCYEQLVMDANGNEIELEYEGHELREDGILILRKPVKYDEEDFNYKDPTVFGIYDLKNKKLISEPQYEFLNNKVQKSGVAWVKDKNGWSRYKIGRVFENIGNENYSELSKVNYYLPEIYYCKSDKGQGLTTLDGEILLKPTFEYDKPSYFKLIDQYLLKVKDSNGKMGIYSLTKKEFILDPIYEDIAFGGRGMISTKKNGKWGGFYEKELKDDDKIEWALDFKYDGWIRPFANAYAIVKDKKYGVVDYDGRLIVPLKFDNVYGTDHKEGERPEYDSTFVGITGKPENQTCTIYIGPDVVIPTDYCYTYYRNGANLIVNKLDDNGDSLHGIFDIALQKETIPCIYQEIVTADKKKDLMWVRKGDVWGLLDPKGETIFDFEFEGVGKNLYRTSRWIVKSKNGVGLIDLDTKEYVIKDQYDRIDTDKRKNNGYWKVVQNSKMGLVEKGTENVILATKYDTIIFDEGLVCARRDEVWDLYNEYNEMSVIKEGVDLKKVTNYAVLFEADGKKWLLNRYQADTLVECPYDEIAIPADKRDMYGNYLIVKKNGLSGVIEVKDSIRVVCPPKYEVLEHYEDGYFLVGKRNEWAYLDQTPTIGLMDVEGNLIVPIEYQVTYDDHYGWIFYKDGIALTLSSYNDYKMEPFEDDY